MPDSDVRTLPGEQWVSFGLASKQTGESVLRIKAIANSNRIRQRDFPGGERGIELNELQNFLHQKSKGQRR